MGATDSEPVLKPAVGKAYGFLQCYGSDFATVEDAIRFAKKDLDLPSELELTVEGASTGLRSRKTPEGLRELGKQATAAGLDYLLTARLPGYCTSESGLNIVSARLVEDIMFLIAQDPDLYGPDASPRHFEIVFEDNGEYINLQ